MTEIVEEPYLQLIRDILDHGHMKDDRTGTGTKSLFGYQMRFDLSKGFPLLLDHCCRSFSFSKIIELFTSNHSFI